MSKKSVRKMSEQPTSDVSPQPKSKKPATRFPKTDARHWQQEGRLIMDGRSRSYSCKIQVGGRRESFPLRTSNKSAAAAKAATVYKDVVSLGWDQALTKHKQRTGPKVATVGALIEANERLSSARPQTLDAYSKALRRIVAGVKGWQDTSNKFDAFKGGHEAWKRRIDDVRLDEITRTKVVAWKKAYVASAPTPPDQERAAVTANSLIRNAKALLSKKMLPLLREELELPSPLPFEEVPFDKSPKLRYRSKIDPKELLRQARDELTAEDPEAFKLLLLTLVCGLRRSEADNLLWRQVDFARRVIVIEPTEVALLKSDDSAGEIGLDEPTSAALQGFHAKATGDFVLEAPAKTKLRGQLERKSRSYRSNATHKRLLSWLRAHGVNEKRPIHTLRKEIGAVIASEQGIYAASRYLRHSDIRITSMFYADTKTPISPGLGNILKDDENIVSLSASQDPNSPDAIDVSENKRAST